MENSIIIKNKETKYASKFKENDRENVIIESVFINPLKTKRICFI
jgi:hypothetical protein